MFSKLFEERDKTITHLVKLGDCIARSLRENVSLFAIDSNNSQVSYLTESGKVISGDYSIGQDVIINEIKVQDSSVFEDGEQLDSFVNNKIHSFVESSHYGEYNSADESFSDILSLWENRLKLSTVQARLYEQSARLQNIERIIPFLIQIPGIDPGFLAKELLKRLDDKMEFSEAITGNFPSIVAQNQLLGAAGNVQRGGQAPEAQGGRGRSNAPQPSPKGGRKGLPAG